MSRVIEFRVWDSYDKKMLSWEEITSTPEFEKNIPDYILNNDRYHCMLKTGLTAKNGKEFHDGDIIQWFADSKDCWLINYDIKRCGFFMNQKHGFHENEAHLSEEFLELFVVGNVYETPELLDKKS
jgi:hypothetical protein